METEHVLRNSLEWLVPIALALVSVGVILLLTRNVADDVKRDQRNRQWVELPLMTATIGAGAVTIQTMHALTTEAGRAFVLTLLSFMAMHWIAVVGVTVGVYDMRRSVVPPTRAIIAINLSGLAVLAVAIWVMAS
jgi:hypothetical protein